jgi:hypothetical protein
MNERGVQTDLTSRLSTNSHPDHYSASLQTLTVGDGSYGVDASQKGQPGGEEPRDTLEKAEGITIVGWGGPNDLVGVSISCTWSPAITLMAGVGTSTKLRTMAEVADHGCTWTDDHLCDLRLLRI